MKQRIFISCAALFAAMSAFAASENSSNSSLSLLTQRLELGELRPGTAWSEHENLQLLVRSTDQWRLSAIWQSFEPAHALSSPAEEFQILSRTGRWIPLVPDVRIVIGAGSATPVTGAFHAFPLRSRITFDARVGVRRARLQFFLNDVPAGNDLLVSYSVEALTAILSEGPRVLLGNVNPASPGLYVLERRTYIIASNVPWAMEAVQRSPLTIRGTMVTIDEGVLRVITNGGELLKMLLNQPTVIATGNATGQQGTAVEVQFAVALEGEESGGEYTADIEMRPVAQPVG